MKHIYLELAIYKIKIENQVLCFLAYQFKTECNMDVYREIKLRISELKDSFHSVIN